MVRIERIIILAWVVFLSSILLRIQWALEKIAAQ